MLTPKQSDFRPASKNQANFDHPPKKVVNRSPHLKQVHFGPHRINFDPSHKKSQLRSQH